MCHCSVLQAKLWHPVIFVQHKADWACTRIRDSYSNRQSNVSQMATQKNTSNQNSDPALMSGLHYVTYSVYFTATVKYMQPMGDLQIGSLLGYMTKSTIMMLASDNKTDKTSSKYMHNLVIIGLGCTEFKAYPRNAGSKTLKYSRDAGIHPGCCASALQGIMYYTPLHPRSHLGIRRWGENQETKENLPQTLGEPRHRQ